MSRPAHRYTIPFEVESLTYDEALSHVAHIKRLGISPMLETVIEMLDELGRPDAYYDCIQIAGTNGKTSTSRFTAAALQGAGKRVGLYTSPELYSHRQRLELDGALVVSEHLALGIAAAKAAGERVNARRQSQGATPYDITEFDTFTVAALVICALQAVDVCVLEVGLGGRWDATSATHPCVVAITGIGLDHTHILGTTLEQIAAEKAAIIRPHTPCVLGPLTQTPQAVKKVFDVACAKAKVSPVLVQPEHSENAVSYCVEKASPVLELTVTTQMGTYHLKTDKPLYQAPNIAMAIALAQTDLQAPLSCKSVAAVETCPTPGRFEVLSKNPLRIIDAAHNPQSIAATLEHIKLLWPELQERPTLLFAVLADKDTHKMVALVAHEFEHIVCMQTTSTRALPAPELAQLFEQQGVQPEYTAYSVDDALKFLEGRAFIATGSITLAGEIAQLAVEPTMIAGEISQERETS